MEPDRHFPNIKMFLYAQELNKKSFIPILSWTLTKALVQSQGHGKTEIYLYLP